MPQSERPCQRTARERATQRVACHTAGTQPPLPASTSAGSFACLFDLLIASDHCFCAAAARYLTAALSNRRDSVLSRMDAIAWSRAPVVSGIDVSLQRHAAYAQVRPLLLAAALSFLASCPCSKAARCPLQNCESVIESLADAAVDLGRGGAADPQQVWALRFS